TPTTRYSGRFTAKRCAPRASARRWPRRADARNAQSEARTSKQIRSTNEEFSNALLGALSIHHSSFGFVSDFELRTSGLTAYAAPARARRTVVVSVSVASSLRNRGSHSVRIGPSYFARSASARSTTRAGFVLATTIPSGRWA